MNWVEPRASIVIPVFNQAAFTRVCLASLELAGYEDAEVIVVDNASTDDTPQLLAEWRAGAPGRRMLRSEENLGFGRGSNWGAEESRGEFTVFLNNDTFVLRDWLPALLRPFDDPTVAVTGSRLLYPNGRIQHAGVAFNADGPHHIFVGLPGNSPLVLEQRDYQVVTGASLAIRRTELERWGRFDTTYDNSFQDVDLCLKVKEAGGRVVYVPDSVAYHWESMTEGRIAPSDQRNYELFMSRWKGRFLHDVGGLLAAAAGAGYDLSDRLPSRRELIDRQEKLGDRSKHLDELEAEVQRLRALTGMRSVRLALWARRVFRSAFPARD